MTKKASEANELLCDNNAVKFHHFDRSGFFKKTWLSGQNIQLKNNSFYFQQSL